LHLCTKHVMQNVCNDVNIFYSKSEPICSEIKSVIGAMTKNIKFASQLNLKNEIYEEVTVEDKHESIVHEKTMYESSPFYKDLLTLWEEIKTIVGTSKNNGKPNKCYTPTLGCIS
jgi:hypothetical protein